MGRGNKKLYGDHLARVWIGKKNQRIEWDGWLGM